MSRKVFIPVVLYPIINRGENGILALVQRQGKGKAGQA